MRTADRTAFARLSGLAIVGVTIVRASLRPLTDIEHTAEAIAAGDLSQRVPYHDPRTEMGRLALSQVELVLRGERPLHAVNEV